MNDFYHICLTAHSEVLLRCPEDYRDITNLVALSAHRSGVQILVDAIMSNHMHFIVLSENPGKFALSLRISITKHFNSKYFRNKRLFDRKVFICKLEGARHIIMAINYVLKNPVHHGQASTPYSYPCSTANFLFAKDRGVPEHIQENYITYNNRRKQSGIYCPKNAKIPNDISIDPNGMMYRSSFEEIRLVESFYMTPNSFIYNMNRRTSDEWIKEQEQDQVKSAPITLELIERGVKFNTVNEMLKNENATRTGRQLKSDTEVCQLIDNEIRSRYKADSIYKIGIKQRLQIAMSLVKEPDISLQIASRAAVVPFQLLQNEYDSYYGVRKNRF